MSQKDQKTSNALAVMQRAGTGTSSVTSMMKVLKKTDKSMLRLFVKNIHLSVIAKKEDDLVVNRTGNSSALEQREGEEPVLKMVRVAVKPPTTKTIGNEWDESINWEPNSKKWKGGLGNQDSRKENLPPFVTTEVPYDVWRKHYAKNKYGRYRGTEAPAENCILVPEDETKWRALTNQEENHKSTKGEDNLGDLQSVKRTVTSPENEIANPMFSPQTVQDSAVPMRKEEAIYVESDGHTALQTVQEPMSPLGLPESPVFPMSSK